MNDSKATPVPVPAGGETFYPVLRTCRSEIAETCRQREHTWALDCDPEELAQRVEQASEEEIRRIALKLGDNLMEGCSYFSGLALAAETVLR